MFRIKICGIKTLTEARAAVDAGADAIGLNFYEKSPRYVSMDVAAGITAGITEAMPGDVTVVGVFVNSPAEGMNRIASSVGSSLTFIKATTLPFLSVVFILMTPWPLLR